jgi:predicted nucleic acid-binding protein
MVLDASCGIKWVTAESDSAISEKLLAAYAAGRVDLWAPDLYVSEVTNIVWKKCRLHKELTEEQAANALEASLAILPDLADSSPLAPQALQLGLALHISTYDALYVALALRLRCPLVTPDRILFERVAPTLSLVISMEDAVRSLA